MKAPRKAQVLLFYVVPFIFIPKLIYYNKSLFFKKSSYLTSECQKITNLSIQVAREKKSVFSWRRSFQLTRRWFQLSRENTSGFLVGFWEFPSFSRTAGHCSWPAFPFNWSEISPPFGRFGIRNWVLLVLECPQVRQIFSWPSASYQNSCFSFRKSMKLRWGVCKWILLRFQRPQVRHNGPVMAQGLIQGQIFICVAGQLKWPTCQLKTLKFSSGSTEMTCVQLKNLKFYRGPTRMTFVQLKNLKFSRGPTEMNCVQLKNLKFFRGPTRMTFVQLKIWNFLAGQLKWPSASWKT